MDRTAPTIFPLNLNHVIGTAAARFQSTPGRLIKFPPTTGYFPAAGNVAVPSRRAVDGARIPFFKVKLTTALTPARRSRPVAERSRQARASRGPTTSVPRCHICALSFFLPIREKNATLRCGADSAALVSLVPLGPRSPPQLPGPARVSSTRRFWARPCGVSFGATGSASPRPRAETRFGLTP